MKKISKHFVLATLLVIPLTLLLIFGNVIALFFYQPFFEKELTKNNVYEQHPNANVLNEDILSYLLSPEKQQLSFHQLYTEKEQSHMQDVKTVVRDIFFILYGSCFVLIATILFFTLIDISTLLTTLIAATKRSAILSGAFFILISLCLLFFDTFFVQFHYLLFDNMNWMLSSDNLLIQLYSQQFFIDSFIFVVRNGIIFSICVFLIAFVLQKKYDERRFLKKKGW